MPKSKKYTIVWGNLFRYYTGTVACTGLVSEIFEGTTKQLKARIKEIYEEKSDLIHVIDLKTGKQADA